VCEEAISNQVLNLCEQGGASYADVRVVETQREFYAQSSGRLSTLDASQEHGMGVRVLKDGAWGFAATADLGKAGLETAAARALGVARASAQVQAQPVQIGEPVVERGHYETPCNIDPFQVPISDKAALLLEAAEAMHREAGVVSSSGTMEFLRRKKYFASTEGSQISQVLIESGAGLTATAAGEDDVQQRHFPTNLARQQGTGGFELIQALDLVENASVIASEAVQLLQASPCPSARMDLIFDPTLLAHLLHEIVGHNTELDRVFGFEAALAGTSFATPELLHSFQYAAPGVHIYLDSTYPKGLGTFGFDDEGVPAQRADLIREGILAGYHTSRETAVQIGQRSNGCMRADSFNRIPIIRMTNILMEPGEWDKDALIADTKEGLYLAVNKSWSISDRRDQFQYGAEIGYEIRDGRLGRMVKNATFRGDTVPFWRSCDGIANQDSFQVYGLPICGKGEPWQGGPISHGCSPARFRQVEVGI